MNPKGKAHVVAVIPARYGSQRLEAKPLIDLRGKPMVQRVYEQASKASLVDRVVVATDDTRIADVARKFGAEVIMTSPGIRSGSDRVAAIALQTEGEIFVNVQGDEPLIAPEMIDEAVRVVLGDERAQVGTLVRRIESVEELENPAVVKVVFDDQHWALYFSRSAIPHVRDEPNRRRWLEKAPFFKHIGLYVFRKEFLMKFSGMKESMLEQTERLEQLRILESGQRIKVGLTTYDSIPIDTKEDVEKVVGLLQHMPL